MVWLNGYFIKAIGSGTPIRAAGSPEAVNLTMKEVVLPKELLKDLNREKFHRETVQKREGGCNTCIEVGMTTMFIYSSTKSTKY